MFSEIVRGGYVIHDEHWYINVVHMMLRLIIATSALLSTCRGALRCNGFGKM